MPKANPEIQNRQINETVGRQWTVVERVGFFGKNRDKMFAAWDEKYGVGNWKIGWQLSSGELLSFRQVFQLYIEGYIVYMSQHPDEAKSIADNYAYCYDKTPITREQAFQPEALVEKPNLPNQFHHVALNLALLHLGYEFKGDEPLQVRDGKADQPKEEWPAGWQWGPGYIPAADSTMIPDADLSGWWDSGTIEDLYQKSKVLLVAS